MYDIIYPHVHLVDFCGVHVGKYVPYMHSMGLIYCHPPLFTQRIRKIYGCFQKLGENPQNGWWKQWKPLFFNGWFGGTIMFGYFWKHQGLQNYFWFTGWYGVMTTELSILQTKAEESFMTWLRPKKGRKRKSKEMEGILPKFHPGRLTWNPTITHLKTGNLMIFQSSHDYVPC